MGFCKIPDRKVLLSFFEYRNGELFWRFVPAKNKSWNSSYSGKKAGAKRRDGYTTVSISGKRMYVHRVIFSMHSDVDIYEMDIDHINGDHSDNRFENLRCVNRCENLQNQKILYKNKSGFKNVHFDKKLSKYHVLVRANNKRYHGGYFANILDAANAAEILRNKLHKEFANHGNGSVLLTKE